MALMVNDKKVLGYALGENKYLDGTGIENLNAFVINSESLDSANHRSFTIDMTKYFNQADAKYPDVKYYQILLELTFVDFSGSSLYDKFLTPLLKRGEIIKQRDGNDVSGNGAISVLSTGENKLTVFTKSELDDMTNYLCQSSLLTVYGFTTKFVGSAL